MDEINRRGIPCFSGSCSEVYLEKAFDDVNLCPAQPLLHARELGETSLMFLVHPTLTGTEIEKTCDALSETLFLAEARD
jgi:dTDP-4-amino-4,6-dideoxygalactose transaminase